MKKWLTKFFENQIVTNILIVLGTFFTFGILDLGIRFFSNQYTNFYGWTHPCLTVRDKNGSKSLVKLGFSFFYYCVLYTYYDILVYEG